MILIAKLLGAYLLIGIVLLIIVILYLKRKSPNYIKSLTTKEKLRFAKGIVFNWVVLLFQFTKNKNLKK